MSEGTTYRSPNGRASAVSAALIAAVLRDVAIIAAAITYIVDTL